MKDKILLIFSGLVAVIILVGALSYSSISQAGSQTGTVVVHSDNGSHTFSVEIMRSQDERSKGLMFRKYLAPDTGMLFDFGDPRPVSMWMKNTYIPLDMLFISEKGVVHKIAANTIPHSTEIISSNSQVRYVLEINGGMSEKLGIKAGNRVALP